MPTSVYHVILIVWILSISHSRAQQPTTRTYGISDGLYQIETKAAIITHDSMAYIGESNNLLSIYDGYSFTPMTEHTNLPFSNGINCNLPVHGGNFLAMNVAPYFYQNGRFDTIRYPRNILNAWNYFLTQGEIYNCASDHFIYRFDREQMAMVKDRTISAEILASLDMTKSIHYRESLDGRFAYFQNKFYKKNQENIFIPIALDELSDLYPQCLQYLQDHNLPTSLLNRLVYDLLFPHIINAVNGLSIDRQYLPEQQMCMIIIKPKTQEIKSHFIAVKANGYNYYALNSNSYIRGGHEGVIKSNNQITYFPSSDPNMVEALHTIVEDKYGRIYFGGYGSGFSSYHGELKREKFSFKYADILPGAHLTKNGDILFFSDGGHANLSKLSKISATPLRQKMHGGDYFKGYYIDTLHNGQLAYGLWKYGLAIDLSTDGYATDLKIIGKDKGLHLPNVLHYVQDQNQRIWCSSPGQGIGVYDMVHDTAYTFRRNRDQTSSYGAISAAIDDQNTLFIGSTDGIKYLSNVHDFDIEHGDLFESTQAIELPNGDRSLVTFMTVVDDYLVSGNRSGVHFMDLKSFYTHPDNPIIYQLIYGEDIQGGGSEQNAVLFDTQRRLWIGSQEGASMIDWDKFNFDLTTNKIKINKLIVGSINISTHKINDLTIPKDNRNCTIGFAPDKNISLCKNIFFDYHLIAERGDTLKTELYDQQGIFEMDHFEPGEYTLIIEAKKHGQLMDRKVVTLRAPMSLTENPWFWCVLALSVMGLITGFMIVRNRQNRRLLENELQLTRLSKDKDNLRVQAIISSFNPHFINNSLHWIQSRYRSDNDLVRLIGRLAKNIENIFSKTREGKAHHSIAEELILVKNYIDIQLIRFKDEFKYEVVGDLDEDELRHSILLMHVQIHVENAIEHGIRHRSDAKYVRLTIQIKGDMIEIQIEDDGIGRAGAKKLGSRGTQSATQMISDLIQIFNEKNINNITLSYQDNIFLDADGNGFGTRVLINYPIHYNYDL